MAKKLKMVWVWVLATFLIVSCQRNYYTSKARNNDCGCPSKKGMVGY